ncbi:Glyoxylase, beta-lactamase superfamily II [Seinonella peptonophila]|uniref:Glyoxylase, beta-lactamase superfamily II n=1 Tax=Seinonella peptonophila TaxID=112248 RepID=A0A1M4T3D4_9BACL|nr:MBL fold metallo-hydrolase [Seinonella peptonophila]SHE38993.1 Glyoxylase, beta-lactamase superfamily II [Seinonella peptonophila]
MNKQYRTIEVKPGLYQIGSVLGPRYVYQYLLWDEHGAILIDAGMPNTPTEAILPFFKEIEFQPDDLLAILISHGDVDHFSGVSSLRNVCSRALIMAHEWDVPWIESVERIQRERYFAYESLGINHDEDTKQWFIDHLQSTDVHVHLKGGEKLKIGKDRVLEVIHVPGHSPGHLAIYDAKNRAMIVIDAVLHKGLYDMNGRIISPPPYYSIQPYIDSIDTILQRDFDVLLTGHFNILHNMEAYQFLHESRNFVNQVSSVVETVVRRSKQPLSLKEVLDQTDQQVGPYTSMAVELIGPVYAHLLELEKKRIINRTMKHTLPHWFA